MRSCCVTDVGQKRTTNQDFVFASDTPVGPLPNLLIVADGMGGHQAEIRSVYFEVQLKQQTKECWKRQQKTKN